MKFARLLFDSFRNPHPFPWWQISVSKPLFFPERTNTPNRNEKACRWRENVATNCASFTPHFVASTDGTRTEAEGLFLSFFATRPNIKNT